MGLKLRTLEEGLFFPNYDQNISQGLGLLTHAFNNQGVFSLGNISLDLSEVDNIVFFIIDGLGIDLGGNHLLKAWFEKQGEWISSTYPSITPTALTSIFTGLRPAQHGIVGHLLPWYKTKPFFKTIMDPRLNWFKSEQNKPPYLNKGNLTVFKKLNFQFYGHVNLLRPRYGLIPMYYEHHVTPYFSLSHLTKEILKQMKCRSRQFALVYNLEYDTYAHFVGKRSRLTISAINRFTKFIVRLKRQLANLSQTKTSLIITSDHGHVRTDQLISLPVLIKEKIIEMTHGVGKSGRTLHFYPREGREDKIAELISENWGAFGRVLRWKEIKQLIGITASRSEETILAHRSGSVHFSPFRGFQPVWETKYNFVEKVFEFPKRILATSSHGGLTSEELYCPFIVL